MDVRADTEDGDERDVQAEPGGTEPARGGRSGGGERGKLLDTARAADAALREAEATRAP